MAGELKAVVRCRTAGVGLNAAVHVATQKSRREACTRSITVFFVVTVNENFAASEERDYNHLL